MSALLAVSAAALTGSLELRGAELFWVRRRTCWISTAGAVNGAKFASVA